MATRLVLAPRHLQSTRATKCPPAGIVRDAKSLGNASHRIGERINRVYIPVRDYGLATLRQFFYSFAAASRLRALPVQAGRV